jgi:uncharacterized protein (DUF1330 family)
MPDVPVVLCVLLWARPGRPDALGTYEDKVLNLLPDHGARVLQRGTVVPSGEDAPAEVQLLEFPSEAALDAYTTDPRRTALAPERDAAVARTDIHRIHPR